MARPKGSRDPKPEIERRVELACKRISERGVEFLNKLIEDALNPDIPKNEKPDARWVMMAIDQVLNRGFGRPKQQIDQTIQMEGGDALIDAIRQGKERIANALISPPVAIKIDTPTIN